MSKSLTSHLNLLSAQFSVSAGGPKAKNVLLILGGLRHYTSSRPCSDRPEIEKKN